MVGKKNKAKYATPVPGGAGGLPKARRGSRGGSRELRLAGLSPALRLSGGLGLRRDFWF